MPEPATLRVVRRREIWVRLVIDPLAGPLGRTIARWPGVTPNRVTGLAALSAVASAACFATGLLRLGGALFLVRFFFDVCDGVVARAQQASSARGAALDLTADVAGIGLCFGALSWYLLRETDLSPALPLGLAAALVFYNWVLAYRKALAGAAGLGDGGIGGNASTNLPIVRRWFALCERLNMNPLPWAVEAETVAFGLAPLILPTRLVWIGLVVALAFYLLADVVNVRRVLRVADQVDGK